MRPWRFRRKVAPYGAHRRLAGHPQWEMIAGGPLAVQWGATTETATGRRLVRFVVLVG
jgi:hypothetical protein